MKTKFVISIFCMVLILFAVGITGSQAAQVLLPGALIPQFVDPLPVANDITVVDATSAGPLWSASYVHPPPFTPGVGGALYNIHMSEFQAQILPSTGVPANPKAGFAGLPANTASWVWGYLTDADLAAQPAVRPSFLGPVVIAERGKPAYPTYTNELPMNGIVQTFLLPIDQTLDWANPLGLSGPLGCLPDANGNYTNPLCGILPYVGPLPDSVHIHGGEVPPASDGGPDAWFTQGNGITGIGYSGNTLEYPNGQEEATIWFHPHGFGITRLNVFAGLAGVYPIVDPNNLPLADMPQFPDYDIPLIIQDRSFDTTGQIFYNLASNPQPNPTVHPFWIPEFIGDAICVNGKTWPYLEVEPRQYRFRLLNGSNARFYDLSMNKGVKFIAIASDDGYLVNAAMTPNIVIAPGERYEVIVDFSGEKPGTTVTMFNAARTPYPGGAAPVFHVTDRVMQFRVNLPLNNAIADSTIANGTAIRPTPLQPILNGFIPPTVPPAPPGTNNILRQLTINEVIGPGGPLELVVNNAKYNLSLAPDPNIGCTTPLCRETELPAVGDTEVWEIINITADAHPMHTHLTSFQLIDRIPFQSAAWINQYDAMLLANGVLPGEGPPNPYVVRNMDGAIGGNPAIGPFLQLSKARPPLPWELGWKDTVIAYPGEVTRIAVRWAPQDAPVTGPGAPAAGTNLYPFDPTALIGGVGYVWHCHILDHEDNEMMRNYIVQGARQIVY